MASFLSARALWPHVAVGAAAFAVASLLGGCAGGSPSNLRAVVPAAPDDSVAARKASRPRTAGGSGSLWVAGSNGGGSYLNQFLPGASSPSLSITSGVAQPYMLAFDNSGDVFVANGSACGGPCNVVEEYPSGGLTPSRTITYGVNSPVALAVDSLGNVYVANATNVKVYAPGATLAMREYDPEIFGSKTNPTAITFDAVGDIYISFMQYPYHLFPANKVLEYAPNSKTLLRAPELTIYPNPGRTVMVFDPEGNLYSMNADIRSGGIFETSTKNGAILNNFRGSTAILPQEIAADSSGNIYVASLANSYGGRGNVTVLSQGLRNVVKVIYSPLFDAGVTGVVVDSGNNLYVNTVGNGVVVYAPGSSEPRYWITSGALNASAFGVDPGAAPTPTPNPPPSVSEYPIPTDASVPGGIVAGPDGALWFTEQSGNKIGRISTKGSISEFSLANEGTCASGECCWSNQVPNASGNAPTAITEGPDGALWFTEHYANKIGRITTNGMISEYSVPTGGSGPYGITVGPDNALYFAEQCNDAIGRITTGGEVTEFPGAGIPGTATAPLNVATDPNNFVWFTGELQYLEKISIDGRYRFGRFSSSHLGIPYGVTAGPDGAMWITQAATSGASVTEAIGRISMSNHVPITEYPLPASGNFPTSIVAGSDDALWFTNYGASTIGRITTNGAITTYATLTPNSEPSFITAGPDGALWFAESGANQIGRIAP